MKRAAWLLGLAVLVAGCGGPAPLPEPGSPQYEAYAGEFYVALAALQVDAPTHAAKAFAAATELVPGEPAGWANYGLWYIRKSQFAEAEAALKKAAELAPESPAVASLQGLLEVQRGQFGAAAPHLRRAAALAPKDLKPRYALIQALDANKDAEAQAESKKLVEEILSLAPTNLVALLERTRVAAKTADGAAFKAGVAALKSQCAGWPKESLQSLADLEAAQASPATATDVLFLTQTLQPLPAYQASLAAVATPASVVGEPLPAFLKMAPVTPVPAPPDAGLAFAVAPATIPRPGPDLNGDFLPDQVSVGPAGLEVALANGAKATYPGTYSGAWAFDFELDGDLDVVAGSTVFQNDGSGKLEALKASPFAAVKDPKALAFGDLDGEGTPEVAFVDGGSKLHVFANARAGRYTEVKAPVADPVNALACADLDADGRLDLLALLSDGKLLRVSHVDGEYRSFPVGQGPKDGTFVAVADLDNNGAPDLVAGAGETWVLLGDGKAFASGPKVALATRFVADTNGDGRLDLVGEKAVAANSGKAAYHWQVLKFRANKNAQGDKRINSFGVGGQVQLRSRLVVQTALIDSAEMHFGLGHNTKTDAVRVVWPNGTLDGEFDLKADQAITAEQHLKGSCPWVFANDGENVEFVTDFIWRSPLGLKINAQDTAGVAQTEDRVKIRGDQLRPVNGMYDVRITAELWETHYFDHVSLMVVDHPAGTEVFVDERFSPRAPPVLDLRVLAPLQAVAGARDESGRDVTADVAQRDGRYLDVGRGEYQGVTRDHWVELPAPPAGASWLVAYGWIHPTDSSINVAIGQGNRVQPRGLSLEAKQADGTWATVNGELGFPAGKNKTVLVPLAGVDGRALRLRTNLEIFWDQLSWGFDAPAAADVKRLACGVANLRYRGFSRVAEAGPWAPELPIYRELEGTLPRWRDLEGFHTRFGDVRELLAQVDDRYVMMNAGDEMALRFPAPAAPAAGLVRDFVLVGDGWEKDGDYNTAFSRTVLPLPSHDAPAYDRAPGALAEDPVYRRHAADWKTYHTRYVTPGWYARGLR